MCIQHHITDLSIDTPRWEDSLQGRAKTTTRSAAMRIYHGKFPVMLTFDVDGETLWLNRDPKNAERPVILSQGRYGPLVGVPRILGILRRHQIRATFFVPGWIAERYPETLRAIVGDGHEIGHHGYLHEWPSRLTRDEEVTALRRGLEAIEKAVGTRPVGYRAPGWELSAHTLALLAEHGFVYSSNMMDADGPYLHAHGGRRALVELPVDWALDDSSLYLYALQLPSPKLVPNSGVLELWLGSFDGLYRDGQSCVLTMHPELTGRPYRVGALEGFIAHVGTRPDTAFVPCKDVAAIMRQTEVRT